MRAPVARPHYVDVFVNDGQARFTHREITNSIAGAAFGGDPVVGDFDGDSKNELVIRSSGLAWIIDGIRDLAPPVPVVAVDFSSSDAVVADIDGDRIDDVVGWSQAGLMLIRGGGTQVGMSSSYFPVTHGFQLYGQHRIMALADVDGDGDVDMGRSRVDLLRDDGAP